MRRNQAKELLLHTEKIESKYNMKLKHESIFFDAFYSQGFQDWPTAKPFAVE